MKHWLSDVVWIIKKNCIVRTEVDMISRRIDRRTNERIHKYGVSYCDENDPLIDEDQVYGSLNEALKALDATKI